MFWLPVACGFALVGALVLDWRRLPQLLPAALVSAIYWSTHTALPVVTPVVTMVDTGLLTGHWPNALVTQLVVAPVIGSWYAQGLAPCSPLPLWRTAAFMALGNAITLGAMATGRLVWADWWHPAFMLVDSAMFLTVVWWVHNYTSACSSPRRYRGDRSARLR